MVMFIMKYIPKFPKIWALRANFFIYFLMFNSELQNSLFSSFCYTATVVPNGHYNCTTSTLLKTVIYTHFCI